jgi:hypothetical protein
MPTVRTFLLTLCLAVVVAVLTWLALRQDTAGLVANVVADLLVVALLTVAFRTWLVKRARRSLSGDLTEQLDDALTWVRLLYEELRRVREWSSRRWRTPDDSSYLSAHSRSYGFIDTFPNDVTTTEVRLERLAAEHGVIDMVPILHRFRDKREALFSAIANVHTELEALEAELGDSLERLFMEKDPSVATVNRVNDGLQEVEAAATAALDDLEVIIDVLERGYQPTEVAARRIALPFPRWAQVTTVGLATVGAIVFVASVLVPEAFPEDFAEAIRSNVLAGFIAAVIAAAVAVLAAHSRKKATLRQAAWPYQRIANGCLALVNVLNGEKPPERKILEAIVQEIRDSVNLLQHVKPDAELHKYAELLTEAVDEYIKVQFALHLEGEPVVLGVLKGLRPPTPRALRLLELSHRLSHRALEVYIEGRA